MLFNMAYVLFFVLLLEFKKDLELLCSAAYSSMQTALYGLYEQNSKVINDRLEELMSVMETIGMCSFVFGIYF